MILNEVILPCAHNMLLWGNMENYPFLSFYLEQQNIMHFIYYDYHAYYQSFFVLLLNSRIISYLISEHLACMLFKLLHCLVLNLCLYRLHFENIFFIFKHKHTQQKSSMVCKIMKCKAQFQDSYNNQCTTVDPDVFQVGQYS